MFKILVKRAGFFVLVERLYVSRGRGGGGIRILVRATLNRRNNRRTAPLRGQAVGGLPRRLEARPRGRARGAHPDGAQGRAPGRVQEAG